jgi:hypothetical protein
MPRRRTVAVREAAARGEAVEMHLPPDQDLTPWLHDPAIFAEDEGDRLEMQQVVEPDVRTIKLDNLVPPIRFPLGKAEIPDNYLELLRDVLDACATAPTSVSISSAMPIPCR